MKTFVFTVLLLLPNALEYSSCERFNIVPSPDSLCPGEFTGEPCFTLEQYAAYPSHRSSNITLNVHPGIHHLNSQLSVSNIYSFTMQANTTATASILCREGIYNPFYFSRLQRIYVSNITFVGCMVYLYSANNVTFVRSSLINTTTYGGALSLYESSVQIKQCIISNNSNGAIYGSYTNFLSLTIDESIFENNSYSDYYNDGGAIHAHVFNGNNFHQGRYIIILNSIFKNNRASHGGGAVYFSGVNVTIVNSTFVNNTAGGGGGVLLFGGHHDQSNYGSHHDDALLLLINNTFIHNSAAYCGVIKMIGFHYDHANLTGNIFTYNRVVDRVAGNNGGGVICTRNASIFILDNDFSHNSAAGDAGVLQADESEVNIVRSNFSNNTAGRNGGALQTYLYPTNYTIVNSSFTYNQAGGDGGAMYVGRAGSHVTIYGSTFSDNHAAERGGVIAVVGSTLQLNRASVYENFARTGEVINSCNSNVTVINPIVLATQEPVVFSLCAPYYDNSNTTAYTVYPTTEQTTPTTEPLTQESTTTEDLENITMTTANLPQRSEEVTSIKDGTLTIEPGSALTTVTTSHIENQDTVRHNLHYIVPSYVAIGVSAVVLVLFAVFGVVITVKMFRVKPQPKKMNYPMANSSAYEYPTIKNTLPEVHIVST